MTTIDSFLDSIKTALIAGVPELLDAGVVVYHHGNSDPDEDIKSAVAKCSGVSALIYDLGGDSDPDDANAPVILAEAAIELYVDTTKRNRRKDATLRTAGAIRDDIMSTLHLSATIQSYDHCQMEPRVSGYRPVADPDYTVYRITLRRSIYIG